MRRYQLQYVLRKRAPFFRACAFAIATAAVLSGCASAARSDDAQTASAASISTSPATATQESSMSAVATPINAEEIGRRVLKLIDSIRSAQDLAPEHIERQTGMSVERNASDPNIYGFGGNLTDAWAYNLVSTPQKQGQKPTSLRFSFDDQTSGKADPADICGLDFQDYSQALKSAGFDSKPMHSRSGLDGWYFSRGDVGVMAYTHGRANPEKGKACISQLVINTYA
jgi:hypothetical protein